MPYIDANSTTRINQKYKNISFKDYLQKFDATNVWEKIDKRNKALGINNTVVDEFDAMYEGIDVTDDLLDLEVQDGDPKIVLRTDGRRRWSPPIGYGKDQFDRYSFKPRLMALIKQAIYQTRNRMVIMQMLRQRFRRNSVYKMGFLMSKTDNACKTFSKFAYKLLKDCTGSRQLGFWTFNLIDIMHGEERLINLWFEVDLLVDLVVKNDENCKRMLAEVMTNRKHAWKFYD
ncbi:uncharacterized protein [Epargyreus clarus]|uniref:uncharacterized protein n=1 Tax=Epargyreus clarus TaxID=520877 RepID=UPI003C2D3823